MSNPIFRFIACAGLAGLIGSVGLSAASFPGPALDENREKKTEIVSTGTTGHAESVPATFDPSQVSFGQLLERPAFYRAEDYYQDYVVHNPHQPYVACNDLPKLTNLRATLPDLLKGGK